MKTWPALNHHGDLPPGLHTASLEDVLQQFGTGSPQRLLVGRRLRHIHALANSTRALARFIIFGSFVTAKPHPNDVDIFMIMQDFFDVSKVPTEPRMVFDHAAAQNYLGASIFWIRRIAAIGGEESAVFDWQRKRDGTLRGIVEVLA